MLARLVKFVTLDPVLFCRLDAFPFKSAISAYCTWNPSASHKKIVKSTDTSKLDDKKAHQKIIEDVRLMNEYFSQYIDEYYEEDDELVEKEDCKNQIISKYERIRLTNELRVARKELPLISELSPDIIVNVLRQQRAKDIVCLKMPLEYSRTVFSHEYVVICEPHNNRHASAVIQNVRKFLKQNYRFEKNNSMPPRLGNKAALGWITIDLRTVALHLFNAKSRQRYCLETLYGIDSDFPSNGISEFDLNIEDEFIPPRVSLTNELK